MSVRGVRPGEVLSGRYRLERLLGRGGWGSVYLARDDRERRNVALKFLEVLPGDDGDIVSRFLREGRTAATVAHAGVPAIYGLDATPDGVPFLIMEYLEGQTLFEFLERHPKLSPEIASAVVAPLLDVLNAAHASGIIHRDLKPSNVMLVPARRQVKVLDFGIAKLVDQSMTRTGTPLGTPAYMAPELTADGKRASPASDLYSVGVMLFEMLAARLPIDAGNQLELMARVATEPAPPLAAARPELEPKVCALVDGLLSKDPSRRVDSALELKRRLLEIAAPDDDGLWRLAADQAFEDHTELERARPRVVAALPPLTDPSPTEAPTDHGTPMLTEPGRPVVAPVDTPRTPARALVRAGLAVIFLVVMSASVVALRLATAADQEAAASSVLASAPVPAPPARPDARQTDAARLIAAARERLAEGKFAQAYASVSYCLLEPACREGQQLLAAIRDAVDQKRLHLELLVAAEAADPEAPALQRPQNAEARQVIADANRLLEEGLFEAAQQTIDQCRVDGRRCSAASRMRLRIAAEKDCLELLDTGDAALTDRRNELVQAILVATSRCVSGPERRRQLVSRVLEATPR